MKGIIPVRIVKRIYNDSRRNHENPENCYVVEFLNDNGEWEIVECHINNFDFRKVPARDLDLKNAKRLAKRAFDVKNNISENTRKANLYKVEEVIADITSIEDFNNFDNINYGIQSKTNSES